MIQRAIAWTVAGSCAVVAAASLVFLSKPVHPTTNSELCAGLDDLRQSFDIRVLSGQAGIRRAGAALAELAERYPEAPQLNAIPAHDAASGLRAVLSTKFGTARDLWTAARPVAVACGQDWRSVSDSLAVLQQG